MGTQVQNRIKKLHKETEDICSKSVVLFQMFLNCFIYDDIFANNLEDKKQWDYLKSAIFHYCKKNEENNYDKKLYLYFQKLEILFRKKISSETLEVQKLIKNIYEFYSNLKILSAERYLFYIKQVVSNMKENSSFSKEELELYNFLSEAITIYLDNV